AGTGIRVGVHPRRSTVTGRPHRKLHIETGRVELRGLPSMVVSGAFAGEGSSVFTLNEIMITALALIGVVYNAYAFALTRNDHPYFELRVALYALLVFIPNVYVILHAFMHFQLD